MRRESSTHPRLAPARKLGYNAAQNEDRRGASMTGPTVSPAEVAAALQRHYGIPPETAVALATAGPEQIRSPWDVPGMEALSERLAEALRSGEPILLFSDFDTDGVTGSAVLFHTLSRHSEQVRRYNPLYREGYGLHVEQVERFAGQGVRLIVTVDTGITSHRGVERAREMGLEVLITDHHLPREDLGPPEALAIDPPDHVLSGAQLAYLTAQALRQRLEGADGHDAWGLALAGVGAQVDWVPVDEPETRAWAARAQQVINSPECPRGLKILRELRGEQYTASDMSSLGGVLNMAKRSHQVDPNALVEALLPETPDERRREILCFVLQEQARCRVAARAIRARAMEDVREEAGRPGLLTYQLHVTDETLAEVEGPLTSRIVAVTGRPTIVLRPEKERFTFSGRARGDFSFESLLNDPQVRSLVVGMGGHRQAIGGSFRAEDRAAFLRAIHDWEGRQPPIEPSPGRQDKAPEQLERLDPPTAHLLGRAIGPFGHRLRRLRFRTTVGVKGGRAFSGDCPVELDRDLEPGEWEITFRFDEAGCDGKNVALRVDRARRSG
jgi:single-stranded-DNA-specific exonuclease